MSRKISRAALGYLSGMQALVLMGVVLGLALLWIGLVFGMLSRLDRVQRQTRREARASAEQILAQKKARRASERPPRKARRRAIPPPSAP